MKREIVVHKVGSFLCSTSSAGLFEEGLQPADPSTSGTSISVAAPTEEITIDEIKLEVEHKVEDDIDSDPKVPF